MAAVVPMEAPATQRKGTIVTIRMMKGVERAALTSSPSGRLIHGAGRRAEQKSAAHQAWSPRWAR